MRLMLEVYSYRKKICCVLYSCEPRVIASLVGFYWQEIRNEILLLHCKPMEGCLQRYILTTVTYSQQKAENIKDEDDSVILFQGLSRRLAVARTEKQVKRSFQVVSRWKAVYNETPVEFIPEEGKTRRCIPLNINQMFSITPGNISLVSVHQTERETDFIYCCTTSHLFIISFHILNFDSFNFLFQMLLSSILNIKKAIAVFQLHAFETIVILSLVAMETAAIFPYSLR
ncbi:hypothetical protein T06_13474, partial [Trichinella sp. T6]